MNIKKVRYNVYVGGEFERTTNIHGFYKLLAGYSDFFSYTPREMNKYMSDGLKKNEFYVDANITVKLSK